MIDESSEILFHFSPDPLDPTHTVNVIIVFFVCKWFILNRLTVVIKFLFI